MTGYKSLVMNYILEKLQINAILCANLKGNQDKKEMSARFRTLYDKQGPCLCSMERLKMCLSCYNNQFPSDFGCLHINICSVFHVGKYKTCHNIVFSTASFCTLFYHHQNIRNEKKVKRKQK